MSKELKALQIISSINLSHMEVSEDENLDGEWEYTEYEEDDGTVEENFPQEINTIKSALERKEKLEKAFQIIKTKEVFISNIKIKDAYDEEYEIVKKGLEVLEEHRKIEQELGIDLKTLVKLNKAEKVYAYGHNGIIECLLTLVDFKEVIIWNGRTNMRYPLCEYGKSFALTRKELEK